MVGSSSFEVGPALVKSVRVTDQSDEDRGQHREDVRLEERNEDLQDHEGRHHPEGGASDSPLAQGEVREHEDHAQEGQHERVSRRHVREEPDHEREGLGQLAQELHRREDDHHDGLADLGHSRGSIEDGLHVSGEAQRPHPGDLHHHERHKRQRARHVDVAGGGGAPGQKPEDVHREDEEEQREDVGGVRVGAVADVPPHHLVAEEEDHRLDGVGEAAGRLLVAAGLHRPGHRDHDQEKKASIIQPR